MMSEHDAIAKLIVLGSAGSLDIEEQKRLEEHARTCPLCRRDLEMWGSYAENLRRLPQPALPPRLMERTRSRLLAEHAAAAGRRWDELMLGALALFAWTVGLTFWFIARVVTGGELVIMGANLVRFGTWTAGSTVLVWLTAAVVALALGKRRRELRRVI